MELVPVPRPRRSRTECTPAALLGRPERHVAGPGADALIRDRVVLVTGAGGSIGSEIARQVHALGPARLLLLDHDESALHALSLQLHGHGLFEDDRILLADVRDRRRLGAIMREHSPDVVFHAAAHKHLSLLERYPWHGVHANVRGTHNVIAAAAEAGVARFVNISTDKAADPISVLGMTKRLAEIIVAGYAGTTTEVSSVRFGNVLGSRGSLLESLAYQVGHHLPVTVTDPDVTRFFMTIPEASGLVLESAAMSGHGDTYVLDMGQPVRILDLIKRYADLLGEPAPEITVTGLRPGEKLHEVLADSTELQRSTANPRISAMTPLHCPGPELDLELARLYAIAEDGDADDVRDCLAGALQRLEARVSLLAVAS